MPPRDLALPLHTGPVEALTRRQLLTAIPGPGILAGGVSCSDSGDGDAAPSSSPSSPASDGFPRDVGHVLGATTPSVLRLADGGGKQLA